MAEGKIKHDYGTERMAAQDGRLCSVQISLLPLPALPPAAACKLTWQIGPNQAPANPAQHLPDHAVREAQHAHVAHALPAQRAPRAAAASLASRLGSCHPRLHSSRPLCRQAQAAHCRCCHACQAKQREG